MSWLNPLKSSWQKIQGLFRASAPDPQVLEEMEDLLVAADTGLDTATWLTGQLQKSWKNSPDGTPPRDLLARLVADRLRPWEGRIPDPLPCCPFVILVVGVNGSGKTTTCAKLALHLKKRGVSVSMVAADLFRAAARAQLVTWGDRLSIPVHTAPEEQKDASGLVFQALQEARHQGTGAVVMDTAGRLHNRTDLMAELAKIRRVLQSLDPEAPHLTLFVLDGTAGQNAINQIRAFQDILPLDGLIVTKLDGTARGGILLNLTHTFRIPVYALGRGEQPDDLVPFEAEFFAHTILGLNQS